MILDEHGGLFTFGSGASGALGHGDTQGQEFPVKVMEFGKKKIYKKLTHLYCCPHLTTNAHSYTENNNIRIHQMSAGVDISMAVDTKGNVYAWGKASDGRLGLGMGRREVKIPSKVDMSDANFKAVDVECSYVHAMIVGLDGSVYQCGGVGTDGKDDGQELDDEDERKGFPALLDGFNIWHRIAEPKEKVVKKEWSKYGKYELKGRSKMMQEGVRSIA
jgi:alpha-tubulin suppressor-like RCC1 family protein